MYTYIQCKYLNEQVITYSTHREVFQNINISLRIFMNVQLYNTKMKCIYILLISIIGYELSMKCIIQSNRSNLHTSLESLVITFLRLRVKC